MRRTEIKRKHIRNNFIELCEEINKSHPEMTEDQYKELILDETYTADIRETIDTLRGYICEEQIKFFSDTMHDLAEPNKTLSWHKRWYRKLKEKYIESRYSEYSKYPWLQILEDDEKRKLRNNRWGQ